MKRNDPFFRYTSLVVGTAALYVAAPRCGCAAAPPPRPKRPGARQPHGPVRPPGALSRGIAPDRKSVNVIWSEKAPPRPARAKGRRVLASAGSRRTRLAHHSSRSAPR